MRDSDTPYTVRLYITLGLTDVSSPYSCKKCYGFDRSVYAIDRPQSFRKKVHYIYSFSKYTYM